jgi:hypothetical protein
MSCDEYTTLMVAGLRMPAAIRERMEQHITACSYHQSETFHYSALDIPVTEKIEQAAREIIKKYVQKCSENGCSGIIDIAKGVSLRIGCCTLFDSAFPCDQCGRLYWRNGSAVVNRQDHKAFLENGQIVHKNDNNQLV